MARKPRDETDRFFEKIEHDWTTGCWLWVPPNGSVKKYGHFSPILGSVVLAHRYAYELLVGGIDAHMTLDHLCREPRCVNPAHMQQVTFGENSKRKKSVMCARGHVKVGDNAEVDRNGRLRCLECRRLSREKRKALGTA